MRFMDGLSLVRIPARDTPWKKRDIVAEKASPDRARPPRAARRAVRDRGASSSSCRRRPAEIAFAGRSNAGKSSAINVLAQRHRLAFASRTPGRTQQIVMFGLPGGAIIADLPGYGYAAVPKALKREWQQVLASYVATRPTLVGLVLVVDARHGLRDLDTTLLDGFVPSGREVLVLATKSDKLSRQEAARAAEAIRRDLRERYAGAGGASDGDPVLRDGPHGPRRGRRGADALDRVVTRSAREKKKAPRSRGVTRGLGTPAAACRSRQAPAQGGKRETSPSTRCDRRPRARVRATAHFLARDRARASDNPRTDQGRWPASRAADAVALPWPPDEPLVHRPVPRRPAAPHAARRVLAPDDARDAPVADDFIYPVFVLGRPAPRGAGRLAAGRVAQELRRARARRRGLRRARRPGDRAVPGDPGRAQERRRRAGVANDDLVPRTVRMLKQRFPELGVITDVALDPYTSHGQDGLIDASGYVMNDGDRRRAGQAGALPRRGRRRHGRAVGHDGRAHRRAARALDGAARQRTRILAYSAKYASSFYGPFRDAVGSAANLEGRRQAHLPDGSGEQRRGAARGRARHRRGRRHGDGQAGLPYLDIVRRVKDTFGVPTAVYQVSGEYAMLKAAAQKRLARRARVRAPRRSPA
jgi:porphobilinogen synthase